MGRQRGFTENDYRKMAEQGYSVSEAAYLMGVKKQTVFAMAKKYGIAFTDGNKRRMYKDASMVPNHAERGSYTPSGEPPVTPDVAGQDVAGDGGDDG